MIKQISRGEVFTIHIPEKNLTEFWQAQGIGFKKLGELEGESEWLQEEVEHD